MYYLHIFVLFLFASLLFLSNKIPTDPVKSVKKWSSMFFKEILQLSPLKKPIPATITGLKQKKAKDTSKEALLQKRLDMIDQAAMSYYKM